MARMPSVMGHSFAQVPQADIQRSSFDRSSGLKTSFDAGYLIPVFVDEALPGDTFSLNMTAFARLATPLHPIMDNMFISSFFFAVPMRLVWDNFQRFMGEQDNPDDSTDYLIPTMTAPVGGYAIGSIFDYLGLPTGVAGYSHSSLPLRACNLIYNTWFRDQNLQDSLTVLKGDTQDPTATYSLFRRGKRHDYFTGSLPWPQKGPSVDIPLGTTAPVVRDGTNPPTFSTGPQPSANFQLLAVNPSNAVNVNATVTSTAGLHWGNTTGLVTDLSGAAAATINSLRQAFAIQQLYERDARGGTRYTEIIRAHFNVVSPDARLQRPEYLGGGTSNVDLFQVPQTSASDAEPTPQGNLAAYGTSTLNNHGFTKSFTEHTIILGFVSVRADLTYQQGLNRMWSRSTKFDFYWPTLAHIGEQAVLNKEIYTQGTSADDGVWGYQERFGEYRYKPSMITGEMRSTAAQSLDTWHLSLDFDSLPLLNAAFIQDDPPIDRVIAVENEPQFIADFYFRLRCARPMPVFGVPGLTRM